MNTHKLNEGLDDSLADLRTQFEDIPQSTTDLGDQAALYSDLIETITGRGIGIDGSEIMNDDNRMSDPDAASDLLHEIAEKMDTVLAALQQAHLADDPAMVVFQAYRHIADDFIHTSPPTIRIPEKVIAAKHAPYELDVGEMMNGQAFEDKLLYPKGHGVWRPSEEQIHHMERLPEDMAYAEAMLKNPYRKKPWDPGSVWLADMQSIIAKEMGLNAHPVIVADQCVIPVPCIGLTADIFYGVDCFIVFRDPERKHPDSVVTIDISLDPNRKLVNGFKADILYTHSGAYVHPALPIDLSYADKYSKKIDAPRVNDRRVLVGKAMAAIIRCRLEKNIPIFRTPDQKHVALRPSDHRALMRDVIERKKA